MCDWTRHRDQFPRRTDDNWEDTSPPDKKVTCLGFAVGDNRIWHHGPLYYWPLPDQRGPEIEAYIAAAESVGFELCNDGSLEPGYDKIVLYSTAGWFDHAAKQAADGRWISKLGHEIDVTHDTPDVVSGGAYGPPTHFLRRSKNYSIGGNN